MRRLVIVSALVLSCAGLFAQVSVDSWKTVPMDASRTGVVASTASNVAESMGEVKGRVYYAPNGRRLRGSARKAAKVMLAAQPAMAEVKGVIAYSTRQMERTAPDCELFNWFVDEMMAAVADSVGRKVDIGIANTGGVRVDMPEGEVLVDDIMSMFPFRNNLCYLSMRGREVREVLDRMVSTRYQIVGGCEVVAKGKELVSVKVGGEPLDDDKLYGVASISFLLDGGDGYNLRDQAEEVIICDGYIMDTMLAYVKGLAAKGEPVEYGKDNRLVFLGEGEGDE